MRLNAYARCMTCWAPAVLEAEVDRLIPPSVGAPCAECGANRIFAITAEVRPIRTRAELRQLHSSQRARCPFDWWQLPFVPMTTVAPEDDTRREQADDHTPTPAEMRRKKGSGSTRPRQSPAE